MKAVVCYDFGPYENVVIEERPAPSPAPDEICVAPRAWGLNYVDVIMVGGTYQLRPDLPFVPGGEAAGIVTRTGSHLAIHPDYRPLARLAAAAFDTYLTGSGARHSVSV